MELIYLKNIFQMKKRRWGRLLGFQRALREARSPSLEKLEQWLMLEVDGILEQEESFWRQKARTKWVIQGERNTRYVHAMVIDRRRKSRIKQLKREDKSWCTKEQELQQVAHDFYQKLYSRDAPSGCNPHTWYFPTLNRNNTWWLNRQVTAPEVKTAMFQLGAQKAPGLDGLPACFFQRYVEVVRPSIIHFISEVFYTSIIQTT